MSIRRTLTILSAIILSSGCATTTNVERIDSAYQPNERDCEIIFFKDTKPTEPYDVIGKIESHIKKNLFFGGTVQLEDEAYSELRLKACELGGDSVIIDDYIDTSAAEMTHVHVWATVLKSK
jgi:hypothetical protein